MNYKKEIVEAGKRLLSSGLTVETWGNISIRDPESNLVYMTPSAMPYSTISEDDVVVCKLDGTIVEGKRKPTVEKDMHLTIMRNRPDINAIIHTHPIESLVFGVIHKTIPQIIDEAAQTLGGDIECTQYALPGTQQLADEAIKALGKEKMACVLANHGSVCIGENLNHAFKVATVLEMTAKVYRMALATNEPITQISKENGEFMRDFMKNHYGQEKD